MILTEDPPVANNKAPRTDTVGFHARDITGTQEFDVTGINRATPAGAVANSLAARMALPSNVPWSLRSDRSGAWLRDDQPIGDQLIGEAEEESPSLTLTPKAHLGAGASHK